jgi:hypothetical protein
MLLSEIARITNGRIITKDAVNHMGERSFRTYEAWKRACKEINPSVQFEGDKDICQAKPGIGEWDGAEGIIYNTKDSKDSALSSLVDLAKGIGKSLMEPTEKAAAGDTKDSIDIANMVPGWYTVDNKGYPTDGPFSKSQCEEIADDENVDYSYFDEGKIKKLRK